MKADHNPLLILSIITCLLGLTLYLDYDIKLERAHIDETIENGPQARATIIGKHNEKTPSGHNNTVIKISFKKNNNTHTVESIDVAPHNIELFNNLKVGDITTVYYSETHTIVDGFEEYQEWFVELMNTVSNGFIILYIIILFLTLKDYRKYRENRRNSKPPVYEQSSEYQHPAQDQVFPYLIYGVIILVGSIAIAMAIEKYSFLIIGEGIIYVVWSLIFTKNKLKNAKCLRYGSNCRDITKPKSMQKSYCDQCDITWILGYNK